jgi:ABC-type cobalamin transport system ATPase subunit
MGGGKLSLLLAAQLSVLMSVGFVAVRAQYLPQWSTAQLSMGRSWLTATSDGLFAFFAGGLNTSAVVLKGEGLGRFYGFFLL